MMSYFLLFLQKMGVHIPTALSYHSTRILLSAMTALMISIFCGSPLVRRLHRLKMNQPVRGDDFAQLAQLHKSKDQTPTMGGILILFSVIIASLLWGTLSSIQLWLLILGLVIFGGIGAFDDLSKLRNKNWRGISSRKKLLLQIFGSLIILCLCFVFYPQSTYQYYLPFLKWPVFHLPFLGFLLFSLFVIIGSSNSVNLTDGLDGLASGSIVPVAFVLALFGFLSSHAEISSYLNIVYLPEGAEVSIFLAALGSACLGFLWYNAFPAQMFMGDTGSLAAGAALGLSAIFLRREFLFALVGSIFVVEAFSVILQVFSYKFYNKKRIFLCAPLHHHFEYRGWAETTVVIRFWIVAFLLASIGLFSIKFQ